MEIPETRYAGRGDASIAVNSGADAVSNACGLAEPKGVPESGGSSL